LVCSKLWMIFARHAVLIRRSAIALGAVGLALILACAALWMRLAAGPIPIDVATPWLVSAIEQNFGKGHRVEVGGTQIERTENGGTALRIRDIVVRDIDGTVVASAPKAEVRVSGMSLLAGHVRAESLNLVGAHMAMRIEEDGRVTVFAGTDKHPIASASAPVAAAAALLSSAQRKANAQAPAAPASATDSGAAAGARSAAQPVETPRVRDIFAALQSWIDGIGQTGLDGHGLRELGLKNGYLAVDDERTGKRWTFRDISLSVERVHGGVEVSVGSDNPERPWGIKAAITPTHQGYRKIQIEADRVSVSNLLLATRLDERNLHIEMPLSASLSGEIGPDGLPQALSGRIVLGQGGVIGDGKSADGEISFERAEFKLTWDGTTRVLAVPFQILSGSNRMTLLAQLQAPPEPGGTWLIKIGGGTVVLGSATGKGDALVLNRIALSGRYDAATRRLTLDEGDLGNASVGVAMSGKIEFSGGAPRLTAGLAGTRMSAENLLQIWPVFVVPKVREWFVRHLTAGTVERMVIAVNSPLENLTANGPPVADDGLSIDILGSGCVVRPVQGLPALRDADLKVHIVGRDAVITLGKAAADLPSGRKLIVSSGVFEVPDTAPHAPPARVHFKIDGPLPAAAELLRLEPLREHSEAGFEPAAMHGMVSAQVSLGMPLQPDLTAASTNYNVTIDATNVSAEHMIMGHKLEAAQLKASASSQGLQIKGDARIGGIPVNLDYRRARGDAAAEIRIAGLLDAPARSKLGFDLGDTVSGAIPIRLSGRVAGITDRDGQFNVETDLTSARIDGLLPGWMKPPGKPARATFVLTTKPQSMRVDDLLIEGGGSTVKGSIEFDGSGQVQSAYFPVYSFSDGDRTTLRIERNADGVLRLALRGELYDGRAFIKSTAGASSSGGNASRRFPDFDLAVKLGAVVGFNGEALRSVDLKMSRRAGETRGFALSAKIGRDANLTGGLRGRSGTRQMINLESNDAGAFLRFTDVYTRMSGGQMVMAMEAPSAQNPAQQGTVVVHSFAIHDETQLERAVTNGNQDRRNAIDFSNMRLEFTRMPGRVGLRDGVVRGPLLGGTIDGLIDYARDEVHLRGTLVPLYGPNNLLAQLPLLGLFLGGEKEGLVGITYEVVGRPGAPLLRINPISVLAPGILRKIFEFPAASDSDTDNPR
jgi:hypothetical protein